MDALALRLANRMVGNDAGAAALEMTVTGATLRFDATPSSRSRARDGRDARWRAVDFWSRCGAARQRARARRIRARASALPRGARQLRRARVPRQRAHLHAGQFGGHGGRALRTGDVLR
jgi:urea carboxylase